MRGLPRARGPAGALEVSLCLLIIGFGCVGSQPSPDPAPSCAADHEVLDCAAALRTTPCTDLEMVHLWENPHSSLEK